MGILEIVFNSRKFDLNDDVLMGFDNYFDKKSKDYNSFCLDEEDINPLQNFVAQIKSADSDSVIYVSIYGYEITNSKGEKSTYADALWIDTVLHISQIERYIEKSGVAEPINISFVGDSDECGNYKVWLIAQEENNPRIIELTDRASDVWHKAKEENDFASFCPILQELVEYNRKFAGYYDAEKAPYDALLNEYERGVDTQQLDVFFDTLRKGLVPLIRAIGEKPQIDDSFLHLEYPVEQQKAFADYLMEAMGLDRGHCGLGETEHPFTLEFNNKDVRITTNYDLHNVASSMYSVLHEGGHALYELGIRDDLQYTCLTGGVSMGVHESQSRFYENLIGRSRAFIGAIYPKVQKFFPAQLGNVTAEQFYRAVNKVEPSLIRTESDELTYCLHVMVRYEIEKQLIAGTLTAKEVPAAWAELYKEYLGVEVPNDREGCLQDSHWSGGSFGYFPSYALGNAYGAQMLHNMEQEFDVYGGVAHGDLSAVTGWLREKVHQYGHLLEPAEVVRNACGTFDAHYYLDYLTKKYTELYSL